MTKVRTARPFLSDTNGGLPGAGAAGAGSQKESSPHWILGGGASRTPAILAFGAIREIEIVSVWPGVTNPSEPTRAFRKTNFVLGLPCEEAPTKGDPASPVAGTISAQTSAATSAAAALVPLPADTR